MKKIDYHSVIMGCDPELFFKKDGKIIGAEKVLPEEGFQSGSGTVIIDGVQGELNPKPSSCRQGLAGGIAYDLKILNDTLLKPKGIQADFSRAVEVSREELDTLSPKTKVFGCSPSLNVYPKDSETRLRPNPLVYRYRAAGGHIHLSSGGDTSVEKALRTPALTIPLMDIIVGNTCVLIDRDSGNIERRKVYGRAGEHRTPKHGLEYRTLSNFWLQSYPLTGMVMGLARQAVTIVASDTDGELLKAFASKVKMSKIAEAINNNDAELAAANFAAIEELLIDITPSDYSHRYPIHKDTIRYFKHFVKKGTSHWFQEEPMEHWAKAYEFLPRGFEDFLQYDVRKDIIS